MLDVVLTAKAKDSMTQPFHMESAGTVSVFSPRIPVPFAVLEITDL